MGYDSLYEIVDPDAFAELVAQKIARRLVDRGQMENFGRFRIWKLRGKVNYSQHKSRRYTDFNEWNIIVDTLFSKSETSSLNPNVKFADNHEYRFA